jgi:hypothetical protein
VLGVVSALAETLLTTVRFCFRLNSSALGILLDVSQAVESSENLRDFSRAAALARRFANAAVLRATVPARRDEPY